MVVQEWGIFSFPLSHPYAAFNQHNSQFLGKQFSKSDRSLLYVSVSPGREEETSPPGHLACSHVSQEGKTLPARPTARPRIPRRWEVTAARPGCSSCGVTPSCTPRKVSCLSFCPGAAEGTLLPCQAPELSGLRAPHHSGTHKMRDRAD